MKETKNPITETEIFICECHSFEHQMKFIHDSEDNSLYVYVHLTGDRFWERLKKGIKYIFGHSSRFGEWDEFIFKEKDESALREFLNKVKREEDEDPLP
jgi:hypothetical protein